MSAKDKKREEKVRALAQQPANRECFECRQRGTGFINMFNKTFVCTRCSGLLMHVGHRVKSISMAKFTDDEVKELEQGGNAAAARVWLATYDPKVDPPPRTEVQLAAMIRDKYEKKKWYAPGGGFSAAPFSAPAITDATTLAGGIQSMSLTNPPKPESAVSSQAECSMCFQKFASSTIQQHAASCTGPSNAPRRLSTHGSTPDLRTPFAGPLRQMSTPTGANTQPFPSPGPNPNLPGFLYNSMPPIPSAAQTNQANITRKSSLPPGAQSLPGMSTPSAQKGDGGDPFVEVARRTSIRRTSQQKRASVVAAGLTPIPGSASLDALMFNTNPGMTASAPTTPAAMAGANTTGPFFAPAQQQRLGQGAALTPVTTTFPIITPSPLSATPIQPLPATSLFGPPFVRSSTTPGRVATSANTQANGTTLSFSQPFSTPAPGPTSNASDKYAALFAAEVQETSIFGAPQAAPLPAFTMQPTTTTTTTAAPTDVFQSYTSNTTTSFDPTNPFATEAAKTTTSTMPNGVGNSYNPFGPVSNTAGVGGSVGDAGGAKVGSNSNPFL